MDLKSDICYNGLSANGEEKLMVDAIVFGFTVFVGWTLFDFVKEKKLKKELILASAFIGVIAALAWWGLGLLLG